jgi:hypothetical protein
MRAKPVTEQQWFACTDPMPMLEFLRDSGKLSNRKARLTAVSTAARGRSGRGR